MPAGIECSVGAETIHATCDPDGVVMLVVSAGVLTVPGSTRQNPVRGFRVMLTGVNRMSTIGSEHRTWLDLVIAATSVVNARLVTAAAPSEPATVRTASSPAAVDQVLRDKLTALDEYLGDEPADESAANVSIGPPITVPASDYCLAIRVNAFGAIVIGTTGSATATITTNVDSNGTVTSWLKLAGFDDSRQLTWGEIPIDANDRIEILALGSGQPDPAHVVSVQPGFARAVARSLRDELKRRYST